MFRFENGFAVEHWDNIQPKLGPNLSGRSMLDGQTESKDKHKTEINRALVNDYVEKVLIDREIQSLGDFIDSKEFLQHNPNTPDGIEALRLALLATSPSGLKIKYARLYRVLAQGNFVLSVSEGGVDGIHSAFTIYIELRTTSWLNTGTPLNLFLQ